MFAHARLSLTVAIIAASMHPGSYCRNSSMNLMP
jgi:hypothetical protein